MTSAGLILLSDDESRNLYVCEAAISAGLATFIDVGCALAIIREKRLYRASAATFEQYVQERWQFRRKYADRLIIAAEVAQDLTPIGVVLEHESHARELAALDGAYERQLAAQMAVAGAQNAGQQPTATWFKAAVEQVRVMRESGGVDVGDGTISPIDAALTNEVTEAFKRQSEHIQERTGRGERYLSARGSLVKISAEGNDVIIAFRVPKHAITEALGEGLLCKVLVYEDTQNV